MKEQLNTLNISQLSQVQQYSTGS